jgi:hypothetical protein
LPITGDEGYDESELGRTVPEAYQKEECNGPFEVDIGMALDKLDGDTGDIIVSEIRKKKWPRRATKVKLTTYGTRHDNCYGDTIADEDDPDNF